MGFIMEFEAKEECTFRNKPGFKHKSCPTFSSSRPFKRRIESSELENDFAVTAPRLTEEQEQLYISSHVPQSTLEEEI